MGTITHKSHSSAVKHMYGFTINCATVLYTHSFYTQI